MVALPGEIDTSNDREVRDALTRVLGDGTAVVVADGSGTSFCSSSGVAAWRWTASPVMRRVLELTGADHVLDTYPNVTAALAGRA